MPLTDQKAQRHQTRILLMRVGNSATDDLKGLKAPHQCPLHAQGSLHLSPSLRNKTPLMLQE